MGGSFTLGDRKTQLNSGSGKCALNGLSFSEGLIWTLLGPFFGPFWSIFGRFWGILRRSLGTSGIICRARWVPKSRTKLTRTLWYTLGTAHDFESKRLQSARSFFISVFAAHQAQLAIIFLWSAIPLVQIAWQGDFEQWVSNPRGHPHRALDKRSSLRSGGRLGIWSADREHNRPVRVVLHHRPEDL
jgi:hypothetical protein